MQDHNSGAVPPKPLQSPVGQPPSAFGPAMSMPAIAGTPSQEFSKPIPYDVERPHTALSLQQLVTHTEREALGVEGVQVQSSVQAPPIVPPPVMPAYSPRLQMYAPRTAVANQQIPSLPIAIPSIPTVAAQPAGSVAPLASNGQSRPALATMDQAQSGAPSGQFMQQPTVVPNPTVQLSDSVPARIYSHNTKAVWSSQRSNKMWSILGLLFGIISVTMLGLYWLSIGSPTTVEDVPFIQNMLLRD